MIKTSLKDNYDDNTKDAIIPWPLNMISNKTRMLSYEKAICILLLLQAMELWKGLYGL